MKFSTNLAVVLLACFLPTLSNAQSAIRINLGYSFPVDPAYVQTHYDGGALLGAGYELALRPTTIIGFDVNYSSWQGDETHHVKEEYNWIPILVYVRFTPPYRAAFTPYFRSGIGMYRTEYRVESSDYYWGTWEHRGDREYFGVHAGFGGEFYTNGTIAPYLETKLNYVFADHGDDITFIDICGGIAIYFGYWY